MNFTYPIKQKKLIKTLMAVYPTESKNRLLLEFGLRTGLRISDILDLKVKDIHKQDFVWVQEKKTKKKKMLYIHPKLRQSIIGYVKSEKLKSADYLFFSEKNSKQAIQRMQAHRIISHAGDMVGVTPLRVLTPCVRHLGIGHISKESILVSCRPSFNILPKPLHCDISESLRKVSTKSIRRLIWDSNYRPINSEHFTVVGCFFVSI